MAVTTAVSPTLRPGALFSGWPTTELDCAGIDCGRYPICLYKSASAEFSYGARGAKMKAALLLVLPLVVSISFLLIADIDSPRGGFIHVAPQNLLSLSQSLPN